MKIREHIFAFLLFILMLTGCAKMPTQKGTWTGVGERVTLYNAQGKPVDALCLRIQKGPNMGDASYHGSVVEPQHRNQFIAPCPILVDAGRYSYGSSLYEGRRLQVRGKVQPGPPIDRVTGTELIRDNPDMDRSFTKASPAILIAPKKSIIDLGASHDKVQGDPKSTK